MMRLPRLLSPTVFSLRPGKIHPDAGPGRSPAGSEAAKPPTQGSKRLSAFLRRAFDRTKTHFMPSKHAFASEPATPDSGKTLVNPDPAHAPSAEAGIPGTGRTLLCAAPRIPPRKSSLVVLARHMEGQLRASVAHTRQTAVNGLWQNLSQVAGSPGMSVRFGGEVVRHWTGTAHNEVDRLFDQFMAQMQAAGIRPGNAEEARARTKADIAAALRQVSDRHGWKNMTFGDFRFEPGKGPMAGGQGGAVEKLVMEKGDISSGAMGSVSIFANANGARFIGKRIKTEVAAMRKAQQQHARPAPDANEHRIDDLLEHEWAGFKKIREEAGSHPNLVHAYGIGRFDDADDPTLLMDHVPGMDGTQTFAALRRCLDARRISYTEYSDAIKLVIDRMLDVSGHLGKAGVVHMDIKPDNIMVNHHTGEPVLIDPGLWARSGARTSRGTPAYAAPEVLDAHGTVDMASDVFSIGATLLHAVEGYNVTNADGKQRRAADGLLQDGRVQKDQYGNAVRRPGVFAAKTAYTDFLARTLEPLKDAPEGARRRPRPGPAQAQSLEYLRDRTLDDDAAKNVLTRVIAIAREEAKKPAGEQWKFRPAEKAVSRERFEATQQALDALHRNPRWKTYADLQHDSRTDPGLQKHFDEGWTRPLQAQLEQDAIPHARQFIDRSTSWAEAAAVVARRRPGAERLPSQAVVKSGVDRDGVRLKATEKPGDDLPAAWATWAQAQVTPHVALDELRAYAAQAEVFLLDIDCLGPIRNPELAATVAQLRQRAQDARRVLEQSELAARVPHTRKQSELSGFALRYRQIAARRKSSQ